MVKMESLSAQRINAKRLSVVKSLAVALLAERAVERLPSPTATFLLRSMDTSQAAFSLMGGGISGTGFPGRALQTQMVHADSLRPGIGVNVMEQQALL